MLGLSACEEDSPKSPDGPTSVQAPAIGAWRELTVASENRCSPYNPDDYAYPQFRPR